MTELLSDLVRTAVRERARQFHLDGQHGNLTLRQVEENIAARNTVLMALEAIDYPAEMVTKALRFVERYSDHTLRQCDNDHELLCLNCLDEEKDQEARRELLTNLRAIAEGWRETLADQWHYAWNARYRHGKVHVPGCQFIPDPDDWLEREYSEALEWGDASWCEGNHYRMYSRSSMDWVVGSEWPEGRELCRACEERG